MKRILLALPLFLVVGLLFVELPVGNSSPNNESPITSTLSPQATPTIEPVQSAPSTSQNIGPSKPSKSKIDIGGGTKSTHSNDDDNEFGEHEGFGEDDD
jgi:hypothetical protein